MNGLLSNIGLYQWLGILIPLFLICLAVVFARVSAARGTRYPLSILPDYRKTEAEELVVIVPGYKLGAKSMGGVADAIREVTANSDIVLFEYNRHVFSNANPFRIAEEIDERIEELHSERQYKRIILVGFSMGALLIRKAYVYGCGSLADAPTIGGSRATSREPRAWVKQVRRFVLLAGMNRGWNPEHRTRYTKAGQRCLVRMASGLSKCTGTGLLIRQAMRGEPFVANLRLQWLEVMRSAEARGIQRPRVIQLLGDRDDVVTKDDNRDVTVARDFIWVAVNNTSHPEMIQVGDSGTPLERKRKIQLAFGAEESIEKLKRTNPVLALDEDVNVRTVVCVLHGIRDMGEWTSNFEEPLQQAYLQEHQQGEKLYVHRGSYGFLAMAPFLIWADRQKNVRWFMDQVTELTARFPNLKEIHFIGHSNGTYVLASALQKYATLKVGRVVLAGSVIRRDYPWSEFSGRIQQVRNYVGSEDIVVGFFPRLFELPLFSKLNRDIGSGGFNGFEDGFAKPMETQFVKGSHAAALVKDNVPSIVDFIIHGRKTDVASVVVQERPGFLQLLSNACWMVWLALMALILAGAWGVVVLAGIVSPSVAWLPAYLTVSVFLVAYVGFLWLLVQTI